MIVCGTGHRPNKLGGYGDAVRVNLISLARRTLCIIKPDQIISGMALGWDQALAEAAFDLKIQVIAAVPFIGQEYSWPKHSQEYYNLTLDKCHEVRIISEGSYALWKMQKRNEYMVDNSHSVLALWDGSPGGTKNCIQYATKIKKPVLNLWNEFTGQRKYDANDLSRFSM